MIDWLHEQKVPMGLVLAVTAWVLGGSLVVAGLASGLAALDDAGLWVTAWGVVLTLMHEEAQVAHREKAAFELGRRVGSQESGKVSQL